MELLPSPPTLLEIFKDFNIEQNDKATFDYFTDRLYDFLKNNTGEVRSVPGSFVQAGFRCEGKKLMLIYRLSPRNVEICIGGVSMIWDMDTNYCSLMCDDDNAYKEVTFSEKLRKLCMDILCDFTMIYEKRYNNANSVWLAR